MSTGTIRALLALAIVLIGASRGATARNAKHSSLLLTAQDSNVNSDEKLLVVLVTSPASWQERRTCLRKQWKRNMEMLHKQVKMLDLPVPKILIKFVIGTAEQKGGIGESMQMILQEGELYGDMLILQNAHDLEIDYMYLHPHWPWYNVSATSEKVLYGIQWAVQHLRFKYLARIGDDAYFRPDEFYRQFTLGTFPSNMAVMGQMTGPLSYPVASKENKIVYPSGAGYIITHDVAVFLSQSTKMLHKGFPEDANFGAWLTGTRVKFLDMSDQIHDWVTGPHYKSCSAHDLLLHPFRSADEWHKINSTGLVSC